MPLPRPSEALCHLRAALAKLDPDRAFPEPAGVLPLGLPAIDRTLAGGLARGALHEFAPAVPGQLGAVSGFALALTALATANGQSALFIQTDFAALEAGHTLRPRARSLRPADAAASVFARAAPDRRAVGVRGGAEVSRARRRHRRTAGDERRPHCDAAAVAGGARGRRIRISPAAPRGLDRDRGDDALGRSPRRSARPTVTAALGAPPSI